MTWRRISSNLIGHTGRMILLDNMNNKSDSWTTPSTSQWQVVINGRFLSFWKTQVLLSASTETGFFFAPIYCYTCHTQKVKNASFFSRQSTACHFLTVFYQKLYRKTLINDKLQNLCPPTFLIVASILYLG